jgi:hypothetical protein
MTEQCPECGTTQPIAPEIGGLDHYRHCSKHPRSIQARRYALLNAAKARTK